MASAKRSAPGEGSPSSRCLEIVFVSSMTAAIAVLKAKRPAMSLVTFSMAQCALRSSSRSLSESSSGTGWSGVSSAVSALMRHSRLRKRWTPSTPVSDQSASWSGGPMKRMYARAVSAP